MTEVAEFNGNMIKVLAATKQHWPNTRRPTNPPKSRMDIPVPDEKNKKRVFGTCNVHDSDFLNSGIYDTTSLINLLEVYGYRKGIVVDWGVGCGRLLRTLPDILTANCFGFDIDPINIAWCNANIPYGTFRTVEPFGKFPIEDKSVSVLYSYSVITHLCAMAQFHWLKEVNRVLDGIAVISVHGLYSASVGASWNVLPDYVNGFLQNGIVESGINNEDVIDIAPDLYYQDVAHTPEYIYRTWSKYINIIDIVPGGFGNHHDAVICKRKG